MAADSRQRVLVAEDDPTVREIVLRYLEREGFATESAADGAHALQLALANPPDLLVLDLMLPSLDGFEVCRRLREAAPVPVIMLTARADEADRVAGLELGADDYLAKPFSPRELTARVKAVLRRANGSEGSGGPDPQPAVMRSGRIVLDERAHEVTVDGELAALTIKEFELLSYLMRHPDVALRREKLLRDVWGYSFGDASTVTVHVRRLREKIETDPAAPRHILTIRGLGYRFAP